MSDGWSCPIFYAGFISVPEYLSVYIGFSILASRHFGTLFSLKATILTKDFFFFLPLSLRVSRELAAYQDNHG